MIQVTTFDHKQYKIRKMANMAATHTLSKDNIKFRKLVI